MTLFTKENCSKCDFVKKHVDLGGLGVSVEVPVMKRVRIKGLVQLIDVIDADFDGRDVAAFQGPLPVV